MDANEQRVRDALAFLRDDGNGWIPEGDEALRRLTSAIDDGRLHTLANAPTHVARQVGPQLDSMGNDPESIPAVDTTCGLVEILLYMFFQLRFSGPCRKLLWREVLFVINGDELRAQRAA